MKYAKLSMLLFLGASVAGAATLTVGPNGQYATPCDAVHVAQDGDTILIDANYGVPYNTEPTGSRGQSDCTVNANNLTIRGVHGRAILDATGQIIEKGILVLNGHDIIIDNLELRNANDIAGPGSENNAAGIRIQSGTPGTGPRGGNITVRRCYIHDNGDGVLTANTSLKVGAYFSPHPFLLFEYDDFDHNGVDGVGQTHNIYIGYDAYRTTTFTLRYSKTRDSYIGHLIKTRAAYNYIYYNQISDNLGDTSYELNFPLGGTTYVVGNLIYKSPVSSKGNTALMVYRDVHDNASQDPVYGPPNEDLHFNNNIVVDDNSNNSKSFVVVSCDNPDSTTCPAPKFGPVLTTLAEVKGNLFIGQPTQVTNQPDAVTKFNLIIPYSKLAALGFQPR